MSELEELRAEAEAWRAMRDAIQETVGWRAVPMLAADVYSLAVSGADLRAKVAAVEGRISASDLIVRMRELTYFGEAQIAGQVVSRMMRERTSGGRTEPEGD